MFEHFKQEVLSVEKFVLRMVRFYLIATALLIVSLIPGVIGFMWIGGLSIEQALINSLSMLGAISHPHVLITTSGQVFTAIYAVFTETIFLVSLGILVAPIVHRVFHKFHVHI